MKMIACPLCHSRAYQVVATVADYTEAFQNVICSTCALVYANPSPTPEELTAYYQKQFIQGRHHIASVEEARERARRKGSAKKYPVDLFLPFVTTASHVLEIGCSYGFLLNTLREATGCQVQGLEPSEVSGAFAEQEYKIPVFHETVETYLAKSIEQQYDLIIIYQVLEHLQNPVSVLRQLKQRLRPEGRLCVCVPDVTHLQEPPEAFFQVPHLVSFSPWSLYLTLVTAGFKPTVFNRKLKSPKIGMEVVAVTAESEVNGLAAETFLLGANTCAVRRSIQQVDFFYRQLRRLKKAVGSLLSQDRLQGMSLRVRKWIRSLRDGIR